VISDVWPEEPLPTEDIEVSRRDRRLQRRMRAKVDRARQEEPNVTCPGCGATGDGLARFYFESPPWTWEHQCGRAGVVVWCDTCERQVDFLLELIN
jgi:hypothetical protein